MTVARSEPFTSLNAQTSYGNRSTNAAVRHLTTSQFVAYDATPELVRDESFGTITVDDEDPLTVTYRVADGVAWSDGEPVDAADLLLSWAANSGAVNTPDFDDEPYVDEETGAYTEDFPDDVVYFDGQVSNGLAGVTQTPELGDDGRSITLVYDRYFADWELAFEAGVPAHVVGARALGIDDADEAKDAVVSAIQERDESALAALSRTWNTDFNLDRMPEDRSLLVANGPYTVTGIEAGQSVELTANPRYRGEHRPEFERVVLRTISDPLEAVAALRDGDVDVITPQASADVAAELLALDDVTVLSGSDSTYEHLDLQFTASRNGHFADARVREAFLRVVPRQRILDELVGSIQEEAELRDSFVFMPSDPRYADAVAGNGSDEYARTDPERARELLAEAGVTSPEVCILFSSTNPRRVREFQLIQESAAEAGFRVTDCSAPDAVPVLGSPGEYDAALFGWNVPNLSTAGTSAIFRSRTGIDNLNGYANVEVDALLDELSGERDPDVRAERLAQLDALVWRDAYGLPLYQLPVLTGVGPGVENVTRSPLPPGVLWNVWDWRPTGS